jgi:hypothetical protein
MRQMARKSPRTSNFYFVIENIGARIRLGSNPNLFLTGSVILGGFFFFFWTVLGIEFRQVLYCLNHTPSQPFYFDWVIFEIGSPTYAWIAILLFTLPA